MGTAGSNDMNTGSATGKGRRHKHCYPVHLLQITKRFEALSSSQHIRHALSVIERIRSDGCKYFEEGTKRLEGWERYCNRLWDFLSRDLGNRRDQKNRTYLLLSENTFKNLSTRQSAWAKCYTE